MVKTPTEMAEKEVNKSLGKSIAKRQLEIKKHQAAIKKLEKEIKKIKSGELVPEEANSSVFSDDTIVAYLLDESGSMWGCRKDTISAFNNYVKELQKKSNVFLTLTKFNSDKVEVVYTNKNVSEISPLTAQDYHPNNCTPLYDAIGKTVASISRQLDKKVLKPKVLFVVMTDGFENTSQEFTLDAVKGLIKQKESEDWSFLYMGADQDAWLSSESMGFAKGNTLSFASADINKTMSVAGGMTAKYAMSKKRKTNCFFVGVK